MMLGMSLSTFTALHVALSLIGILAGIVWLVALAGARHLPGWAAVFLLTTMATSVTGFLFPGLTFSPAVVFGIVSLGVLTPVVLALYRFGLAGPWRWIYIAGGAFALYLNCVVLVVQSFQKLGFLKPLAPTQSEPPFLTAQGIALVGIVILAFLGLRRFRPAVA